MIMRTIKIFFHMFIIDFLLHPFTYTLFWFDEHGNVKKKRVAEHKCGMYRYDK